MPATLRCMVTLEILDKKLQQLHLVSDDGKNRIDIFINAPTGVFELKEGREYMLQFIPVLPSGTIG